MSKRSDNAALLVLLTATFIFAWMLVKGLFSLFVFVWRYRAEGSQPSVLNRPSVTAVTLHTSTITRHAGGHGNHQRERRRP